MRTTQKEISNYNAIDITHIDLEEAYKLERSICRRDIAYSIGAYGCNGVVFEDLNTNKTYKIVGRTSILWLFM